jgi:predicted rRNA methylase YqxC with S4 and FtsJ domains
VANERLDAYLVANGLASGRDKACERIRGGEVTVNCSNNNTILKETEWFSKNRTWPSGGV